MIRAVIGLRLALCFPGAVLVAHHARAGEDAVCPTLADQFEARRPTLAAPQVSAALFAAADKGCVGFATHLIDSGASVAARDRTGGSALTHAARAGQATMINALVAQGADINLRTVQGATPLFTAVQNDRTEAALALIALGADVNLPGAAEVTPVSAAAFNGNLALVELLLAHHADAAKDDKTGKTPVLYAAARGHQPIVARLLALPIDINATYAHKLTLLMWAAGYASDVPQADAAAVVTMLISQGAALDAADDRGRTALMTAASLDHPEIVALLLHAGANPDLLDAAGQSAAQLAATDIVKASLASTPARP